MINTASTWPIPPQIHDGQNTLRRLVGFNTVTNAWKMLFTSTCVRAILISCFLSSSYDMSRAAHFFVYLVSDATACWLSIDRDSKDLKQRILAAALSAAKDKEDEHTPRAPLSIWRVMLSTGC